MATGPSQKPQDTRTRGRDSPAIPDHEMLRQIGKGSFGEVWIARAVTGVFRAVKLIYREDFDHERDFEREFEAIMRYEPISRQHPGLVHVLQVGREDEDGYYYYIMEIADDVNDGEEIEPDSYVPHTFRTEMLEREEADFHLCIEQGAQLAEALDFLHENDLIHRDVKLSNAIIVAGQAKLADIGLVAALGDRSFVGTEGYVPPEGAGTASADIFSLGMVIYELSTRKDRLDFPDVPTDYRERTNKELWRRINRVVCRACARRVEARYATAADMARALHGEELEEAKKIPLWSWAAISIGAIIALILLIAALQPEPVGFPIVTQPEGAKIFVGADFLGETPFTMPKKPEEGVTFEFRLEGYSNTRVQFAGKTDERDGITLELEESLFPQPGAVWTNSLGLRFTPIAGGHRLEYPIHTAMFLRFARDENRVFEGISVNQRRNGESFPIPIVSSRESRGFVEWIQKQDMAAGFIGPSYTYRTASVENPSIEWPRKPLEFGRTRVAVAPFSILVGKQRFGGIKITSYPSGARVVGSNGKEVGETPFEVERIRTGKVSYELRLAGYKPFYVDGTVQADGIFSIQAELEEGQAVEFGTHWQNSLGMNFAPVEEMLVSTVETRVIDFRRFCEANELEIPPSSDRESHPVDGVSREDAEAFCAWLTDFERETGWLTTRHKYRLPSDVEWSTLAGLPLERGPTPSTRNGHCEGIYPWGFEWPPPDDAGNFADESLREADERQEVIDGYRDSFPGLAWVNELRPNQFGLYHVSGNVWEWVSDDYFGGGGGSKNAGTIRGGNWETWEQAELLTSYRLSRNASERRPGVGFRIVLVRTQTST